MFPGFRGWKFFFVKFPHRTVSTSWGVVRDGRDVFYVHFVWYFFVVSQAAFKKDVRRVCVILLSRKNNKSVVGKKKR